jgi:nucleoside-diphosphate-sugar epimerase
MTTSAMLIETLWAWLRAKPRTWLVMGAAGFIGSHLACQFAEHCRNTEAIAERSRRRDGVG